MSNRTGGNPAFQAALYGMLTALALVLSFVETMIPISFGGFGIKLGLANLVTVVGLYTVGTAGTVAVSLVRIFVAGLTFGNAFSMMYSLGGWVLSILLMVFCKKKDLFSPVGISIIGGVGHNVGQLCVAALVVRQQGVFVYLPLLLVGGVGAGLAIGLAGGLIVERLPSFFKKVGGSRMALNVPAGYNKESGNEKGTGGRMMIYGAIRRLVQYGLDTGLIEEADRTYAINLILDVMGMDEYYEPDGDFTASDKDATSRGDSSHAAGEDGLESILKELMDYAHEKGTLPEDGVTARDLFDTKLMNCLMPRPSQIEERFWKLYREESPEAATDYYYKLSQDSDYIRRYRIKKDVRWVTAASCGDLDVTINLSKPEKDPRAIAAAKLAKQGGYPKCLLCMENEGYAGRANHPARNNHRIIRMEINGGQWGLQYSPYVYYKEHCIVLNGRHVPMKIERATFVKLMDFIRLFPHYFLGSNADLPIVGGSILSHDHFQGGNYTFAMAKAPMEKHYRMEAFPGVEAGIVKWPMAVIRLRSQNTEELIELGDGILQAWRGYTDEKAFIYAKTDGEPHNTITPIARKRGGLYELDLVLRNNITTKDHPMGVFHPHQELHHIKKENIGLIEVMGLAVLPSRLKEELAVLAQYIVKKKDVRSNSLIEKHGDWVDGFLPRYQEITVLEVDAILKTEVGLVFERVLQDAGVYKENEEGRVCFDRFLEYAGFTKT